MGRPPPHEARRYFQTQQGSVRDDFARARSFMNRWAIYGAVSAFIAVAMGAFGAHGLSGVIDEHSLDVFKTGAQYQMYHALALLLLGSVTARSPAQALVPGWAFVAGTALFSGSLYLLAI